MSCVQLLLCLQAAGGRDPDLGVACQDAARAVRDRGGRGRSAAAVPGFHTRRRHDRQSGRYVHTNRLFVNTAPIVCKHCTDCL